MHYLLGSPDGRISNRFVVARSPSAAKQALCGKCDVFPVSATGFSSKKGAYL